MEKLLWKIIKDSRGGKELIKSQEQYDNLEREFEKYDDATVKGVNKAWREKKELYSSSNHEFEGLHYSNGGIVNSGDDGFYMDFANWLMGQGEDLYYDFKKNGRSAVLNYIKKHNIPQEEYRFECFIYAIPDREYD